MPTASCNSSLFDIGMNSDAKDVRWDLWKNYDTRQLTAFEHFHAAKNFAYSFNNWNFVYEIFCLLLPRNMSKYLWKIIDLCCKQTRRNCLQHPRANQPQNSIVSDYHRVAQNKAFSSMKLKIFRWDSFFIHQPRGASLKRAEKDFRFCCHGSHSSNLLVSKILFLF